MRAALFDVFGTVLTFRVRHDPWRHLLAPLSLDAGERQALRVAMMPRPMPDLEAAAALLRAAFPGRPQPARADLERARAALGRQIADCVLVDGAWEVLETLRTRGLRLALISNLSSPYCPLIDRLGLGERVDAAVLSCEVGLAKPDPRIFRAALERLRVAPGEAVMIGDSPRADVEGARAVGIRPLWIHPERGDLRRLRDALAALDAPG